MKVTAVNDLVSIKQDGRETLMDPYMFRFMEIQYFQDNIKIFNLYYGSAVSESGHGEHYVIREQFNTIIEANQMKEDVLQALHMAKFMRRQQYGRA